MAQKRPSPSACRLPRGHRSLLTFARWRDHMLLTTRSDSYPGSARYLLAYFLLIG